MGAMLKVVAENWRDIEVSLEFAVLGNDIGIERLRVVRTFIGKYVSLVLRGGEGLINGVRGSFVGWEESRSVCNRHWITISVLRD